MSKIEVNDYLLSRMETLYGAIPDPWKERYVNALCNLDMNVLRRAWENLVDEHPYQRRPSIPEILDAYRKEHEKTTPPTARKTQEFPWEKREKDVTDMTDRAVQEFQTCALWQNAQSEGWEWHLLAVVRNIAHIQASVIQKAPGFGYDATLLPMPYDPQKIRDYIIGISRAAAQTLTPCVEFSPDEIAFMRRQWSKKLNGKREGQNRMAIAEEETVVLF